MPAYQFFIYTMPIRYSSLPLHLFFPSPSPSSILFSFTSLFSFVPVSHDCLCYLLLLLLLSCPFPLSPSHPTPPSLLFLCFLFISYIFHLFSPLLFISGELICYHLDMKLKSDRQSEKLFLVVSPLPSHSIHLPSLLCSFHLFVLLFHLLMNEYTLSSLIEINIPWCKTLLLSNKVLLGM